MQQITNVFSEILKNCPEKFLNSYKKQTPEEKEKEFIEFKKKYAEKMDASGRRREYEEKIRKSERAKIFSENQQNRASGRSIHPGQQFPTQKIKKTFKFPCKITAHITFYNGVTMHNRGDYNKPNLSISEMITELSESIIKRLQFIQICTIYDNTDNSKILFIRNSKIEMDKTADAKRKHSKSFFSNKV